MEKIMSKTDTPNDHRPLADSELDAVTGGAFDCFFEYTERTLGGPDARLTSDPNGGGVGPAIAAWKL
jgi:hypothetical protein